MNINLDDIFNFYEQRIKCHVKAVNYFAYFSKNKPVV